MDFTNLFNNQKRVVNLINNSYQSNRLVNTYLFVGQKGTFKMDAALYLASLILCTNHNACGKCDECRKIESLANPNLSIIYPDNETIKKEQVEELEHEFSLTSDSKKVFIIKDIDKATKPAANSLLKFLESLTENSYGILLTQNESLVLPTIKSRSMIVNFLPINKQIVVSYLMNKNISEEIAKIIATLTNNVEESYQLATDPIVNNIISLVLEIGYGMEENENIYLTLIEKGNFLNKLGKTFHEYFLDLLLTLQNDKIKSLMNINDNLTFSESLYYHNLVFTVEEEMKILDIILSVREKIKNNVNIDLLYASMLIEIGRI